MKKTICKRCGHEDQIAENKIPKFTPITCGLCGGAVKVSEE